MANKYLRMAIWSLDEKLTLDELPSLLNLDYTAPISYLEDSDLPQHDKILRNRWLEYHDNQGFNSHEVDVCGTRVNCLPVLGVYELPSPEREAVYDGFIVPRSNRVHQYSQPVFFFENYRRLYVVVVGPASTDSRLRSALMGGGRPRDPRHVGWGRINSREIRNYTFPSDFLYWLISKQNTTIHTDFSDISITDIRYLAQSTERNDARYMSEGSNLLDDAVPQTGLGVNSLIGQVGTTLIIPTEANLRLIIRESGECLIDPEFSAVNGPNGEFQPIEDNLETVAMLLYMVVLPGLRTAYHTDENNGTWTDQHASNARKQWALGAINELCASNNITLDEISHLSAFA